jgi:hypothetical protein
MEALVEANLLIRTIFDEAHNIALAIKYHICYERLNQLVCLGEPIHFLSATLFPWTVQAITEKMCINIDAVLKICSDTFQPNVW